MLFIVTGVLLLYTSMVVISSAQAAPIPSVWSVTLDTSAASQPGMLHFLVTFSENVTGVDTSDFSLSGDVGTAIITQVTPHTTTSYIVELTNTHDSRGLMLAVRVTSHQRQAQLFLPRCESQGRCMLDCCK